MWCAKWLNIAKWKQGLDEPFTQRSTSVPLSPEFSTVPSIALPSCLPTTRSGSNQSFFGPKYFLQNGACLVSRNLCNTLKKCKPRLLVLLVGSIAPGTIKSSTEKYLNPKQKRIWPRCAYNHYLQPPQPPSPSFPSVLLCLLSLFFLSLLHSSPPHWAERVDICSPVPPTVTMELLSLHLHPLQPHTQHPTPPTELQSNSRILRVFIWTGSECCHLTCAWLVCQCSLAPSGIPYRAPIRLISLSGRHFTHLSPSRIYVRLRSAEPERTAMSFKHPCSVM